MGFRSFGVVALAFLAACSGGGTEPVLVTHTLSGVVRDSLANRGLPDMLVVFGDSATLTDENGEFSFEIVEGRSASLSILTDNPLYGTLQRSVTMNADQDLTLFPMRNAPFVSEFVVTAEGNIEATVSHQAGAAAARRPETWLVFNHGLPGQSSTYQSTIWNWVQSGPRSWRVNLPLANTGIQNAFFNLVGPNGIPTPALCEAATGTCENDNF